MFQAGLLITQICGPDFTGHCDGIKAAIQLDISCQAATQALPNLLQIVTLQLRMHIEFLAGMTCHHQCVVARLQIDITGQRPESLSIQLNLPSQGLLPPVAADIVHDQPPRQILPVTPLCFQIKTDFSILLQNKRRRKLPDPAG